MVNEQKKRQHATYIGRYMQRGDKLDLRTMFRCLSSFEISWDFYGKLVPNVHNNQVNKILLKKIKNIPRI